MPAAALTIAGNVDNAGTIILDDPPLTYSGSVSLTGGGQIQMVGPSSANVISGTPGTTLTNVDNTIVGSAYIGTGDGNLTFINKGTVDATPLNAGDSGLIVINTGNQTTNTGVFEATGGGTFTIDDALLNSGKLEANRRHCRRHARRYRLRVGFGQRRRDVRNRLDRRGSFRVSR